MSCSPFLVVEVGGGGGVDEAVTVGAAVGRGVVGAGVVGGAVVGGDGSGVVRVVSGQQTPM